MSSGRNGRRRTASRALPAPSDRAHVSSLRDDVVGALRSASGDQASPQVVLPQSDDDGNAPLASSAAAFAEAERRVAEADAEIARLQARIHELETWLQESARFEDVEQVQLGRMLAHASAERDELRLPWIASAHLLAAAAWAVAAGGLVWVVLASHL